MRRDVADKLQIWFVNLFNSQSPEKRLSTSDIEVVWDDIYKRLCKGESVKQIEQYLRDLCSKYLNNNSENTEEKTMANNNTCPSFDIKKLCYELYKLDWKREHGITHDMTTDALKNYYEEFSEDYSFEDYLRDFGYEGKVYVCFDEFLANEYLEEEYICKLLDNTNLIDLYLQDIHPVPKGDACKTLCFTQEEFKTLFESIFGKHNVDVDEKNALYNEVDIEFNTTSINGGICFCAISDNDVYDRISERLGVGVVDIHLGQGEEGVKDGDVWVVYKEPDSILVKTSHGVLSAVESPDPTYPGVDIELQPENLPEDYNGTLPRVLFEEVDGKLRVLVWAKSDVEDYTHIIRFE